MICLYCDSKTYAKNLCAAHYMRLKRHGDPHGGRPTRPDTCQHESCDKVHYSLGYCLLHYRRFKAGTDLNKPLPKRQDHCDVIGCERLHYSKGFCNAHWIRWRKHEDPRANVPITRLRAGGRIVDPHGYILVWTGHRYEREHRVIMEEFLDRKLTKDETIHHKNGNRSDNCLNNLELWSSSHPTGQRVEDKINWAKGFLDKYSNDELYEVEVDR